MFEEDHLAIKKMLINKFSPIFSFFDVIKFNNDGTMNVKIIEKNVEFYAVIDCSVSYKKDKLNIVNMHFDVNNNLDNMYIILDIFNGRVSTLMKETLKESFHILKSTVKEISIMIPNEDDEVDVFHIDVCGIVDKSVCLEWYLMFSDKDTTVFEDSKDLIIIEYLYKISSDVMETCMERKYAIYDPKDNDQTYKEFKKTYDSNENDRDLLKRYRRINIQDLSIMLDIDII